jgi:glycosyltransferase involved in cell wall biosynthesis
VEWWGERRDIAAIFAAANIVCLPSYREGLPKVLLEAASCGRAIVTTDVSGCREVVRHGDNGLLVPAREDAPLAEALAQLIADPALRNKMGLAGRERAVAEFSETDVLRQTLAVYRELLERVGIVTAIN